MLKDILTKLGVEFKDDISDEEAEQLINDKIDANNEHITNLEAEKVTLSKSNEELTASVEGIKAEKEKVDKELSDTKGQLSVTKGQLDQITGLYKENFTKPKEEQEVVKPNLENVSNDVLHLLLEAK